MSFVSLCAYILMLSGCATLGGDKLLLKTAGTKVVVVSLLGNQMYIQHAGTTVFSNQKREVDVASWSLDQFVEDKANALIETGSKFTVVKAKADGYRQKFGSLEQNFWTGDRKYQNQAEGLHALATESGADLVIIISPIEYGDVFFSTNQLVSGYGIYQRSFLRSQSAVNFMTMAVHVMDAKTGEEVSSKAHYASSKRNDQDWIEGESLPLSTENELLTRQAITLLAQDLLEKELAELQLTD
ncbi:MAG: hypothetical protein ACAH10_14690 [Methylophilaceae bacterium]|nr:hypothetical protein [Methylotenera sp.]